MQKSIYSIVLLLLCLTASADEKSLSEFILSFNEMNSNCDQVSIEKTYDSDGAVFKITLLDLAELGNEAFSAGLPIKKIEMKNKFLAEGKRYSHYNGKKVKEVFRFQKDEDGNLKSVSLKRYKRKLVGYNYLLGGIVCNYQ